MSVAVVAWTIDRVCEESTASAAQPRLLDRVRAAAIAARLPKRVTATRSGTHSRRTCSLVQCDPAWLLRGMPETLQRSDEVRQRTALSYVTVINGRNRGIADEPARCLGARRY